MDFPEFAVACGEEGSDPLVWHAGRLVRVDEFTASGHLARQDADLADVASLGVRVWRYGMPWRLTERAPGDYDWTLWDRALAACARHGLLPVIDLCHFGLPDHYPGFCEPSWVEGFCRYVDAFLERFREPCWFTPINEPGITALLSAFFGLWNDRCASRKDFFVALGNVTLANLEALTRIRADRDGWWIGAEGFTCPIALTPDAEREANQVRALSQAVWDLHFGVPPRPEVADLYDAIDARVLSRIADLAVGTHHVVAGHDFYPVSVQTYGGIEPPSIQARMAVYGREARAWHERYRHAFWVAETSNLGLPVEQQSEWLDALVSTVDALRAEHLPVRGLCWYSRGDQYDWETALVEPVGKVTRVGLYDAERRARPVATAVRQLARRVART